MPRKKADTSEQKQLVPEVNIGTIGHIAHGKCIDINESVLLNGQLVTGKELSTNVRENGTIVSSDGIGSLYKLPGLHTFCLNNELKLIRKDALVYLQKYVGQMVKITTKTGKTISLTPNHPLLLNENGSVRWEKSRNLKTGDYIATLKELNIDEESPVFDGYVERLQKEFFIKRDGRSLVLKHKSKNHPKLYRILDHDLDMDIIKVLAFVLSDGHIPENKCRIGLTQKNYTRLLHEVLRIFKNKFGVTFKRVGSIDYHLNNKALTCYLTYKYLLEGGIPRWLIFSKRDYQRTFIKWFFTLEADFNKIARQIIVHQKRKNNVKVLNYMLLNFGIRANIIKSKKCATNTKLKKVRTYYGLTISGAEVLKFLNLIGTFDEKKKKELTKNIGTTKKEDEMSIPADPELLKRLFQSSGFAIKNKGWYYDYQRLRRDGRVSHRSLRAVLEDAKSLGLSDKEEYMQLGLLCSDTIRFDKIKRIEQYDYNDEIIDLVVPDYHNFIGGDGVICHNTTLVHTLTGKWTLEHSEELKRGLTIRLGYADFTVRKCPKCDPVAYTVKDKCPNCSSETVPVRRISFVDAPGHETLMATMLTGAATMDGAILVIAANETCPQPQTSEHLTALEISGVKNIVIVQNKVDLVDEARAKESYKEIKNFVKGTIAENAPIIPVSAQYSANIDVLLEAIEKTIPTPKRNLDADPIFLIARSFDVNKPGTKVEKLAGGVLGGIMKQGRIKVDDKIEIRPGRKEGQETRVRWVPIETTVTSATIGGINVDELAPGGSAGLGTSLDPSLTKADTLVGQVAGLKETMPPVFSELELEVHLLTRVVGSKEELAMQPLKPNEPLMVNGWTARSVGILTKITPNIIKMALKLPICINKGERIALSRRLGQKWRLIGYGIIK